MTDLNALESLYFAALEQLPAERPAFLDEACGGDADLRARVERLLAAQPKVGGFLDAPAATADLPPDGQTATFGTDSPTPTADFAGKDEHVGAILGGKYKLIEAIGEGGMGSVYMAQQTEPVKRAVAVKVIKAGMDSKAVLARFEAERQALAMMDHPNIARVLDAGTTESGRPYFVMELVKGVPITQFCDERKLTPRQRLELFVPVCQAIQHAHQKGVIHRDIKPSNVLVALYDDRPVPKVIDFGIAKAAGSTLTDKTLMTGFGAVVGTPEYMSPEQASLNNLDIDTRSDVYSLGVLLYELLTGSTPVDRKSLGKAALLEILRIVREVEAPRPSAKLSTSDALPSISANRGTQPAKLSKLMKGELDWVLLKALEKDRTRRYDTANGLARDIQRYLADEVVEARPPSTGYRLKKFVKRHKGQVIAASLVLLALVAGVIGTTIGLLEARRQADVASDEAKAKEKAWADAVEHSRLAEAARRRADEEAAVATEGLRFFQTGTGRVLLDADGGFELNAGAGTAREFLESAERRIDETLGGRPLHEARARRSLGWFFRGFGDRDRAVENYSRAAVLLARELGAETPEVVECENHLAEALAYANRPREAAVMFERVRAASTRVLGVYHGDTLLAANNLACSHLYAGKADVAISIWETVLPDERTRSNLPEGDFLLLLDNYARAMERERQATTGQIRVNWAEIALNWQAALGPKKQTAAGRRAGDKNPPQRFEVDETPPVSVLIRKTLDRLTDLCLAANKPDEAKKYRDLRAKYPPELAPPPKVVK